MKLLISTVPIFAGLSEEALEIFLDHALKSEATPGQAITHEGEVNHCMYLIDKGVVRVIKNHGQNDATTLATLGPGEFFGEMCILDTMPRAASGIAQESSVVVSVSSHAFYHLYQKMPDQYGILILNIARDLSRRLRRLDEVFAARH